MNRFYSLDVLESLKEKCWKLSSYIMAHYDYQVLAHPWEEPWCIFENDFRDSFELHFSKELIEMAGLIRAMIDRNVTYYEKCTPSFSKNVGELIIENGNPKQLEYREACNKIIHGLRLNIDLKTSSKHPFYNGKNGYEDKVEGTFKNPIIELEGTFNGKKWIAKIEFLKFIEQTMNFPNDF